MKKTTKKPEEKKKQQIPPPRIDIIELATNEVVHSFPLKDTSDRHVERVMMGLLTNMDTERFVASEVLK